MTTPAGAKAQFDRAIDLLGESEAGNWPFYEFSRAICAIRLDPNYVEGKLSGAASRKAILQDLRTARRGVDGFNEMLDRPFNIDVRRWLQLNGLPRLD